MIKRFLRKIIRENTHPRCHYTRKGHMWKPKYPYETRKLAEQYIKAKGLLGYEAYMCPICGKWHIGFHKREE